MGSREGLHLPQCCLNPDRSGAHVPLQAGLE